MASYRNTSLALFLLLNLLPFSLAVNSWTPSEQKSSPSCPVDTLKFGVCADLLGSLLNVTLGTPPLTPCCSLIDGLVDLEAAVCVCTALKANILGININIPLSLSLLLNVCSKKVPQGYLCS